MLLRSSKTVFAAKKMMSLVSRRADADSAASSSSLSLRAKKKKKLYRPEISSPIDMPAHPVSLTQTTCTRRSTSHVLPSWLAVVPCWREGSPPKRSQ